MNEIKEGRNIWNTRKKERKKKRRKNVVCSLRRIKYAIYCLETWYDHTSWNLLVSLRTDGSHSFYSFSSSHVFWNQNIYNVSLLLSTIYYAQAICCCLHLCWPWCSLTFLYGHLIPVYQEIINWGTFILSSHHSITTYTSPTRISL